MPQPKLIPTESPGYLRDSSSGAIINTNIAEFNSILQRREQNRDYKNMKVEIEDLKSELSDIRSCLQQILNGNNN